MFLDACLVCLWSWLEILDFYYLIGFVMNKVFFASVLAVLFSAGAAVAAPEITDIAQVLSSRPIFQNRSHQECHLESVQAAPVQDSQDRGVGGSVLGGVAGALIGSRFGGGNGNSAAIGLGAIAGVLAGDRIQNNGSGGQQAQVLQQKVCNQVNTQDVTGYEVHYLYQSREGVTRMSQQPGSTVRVGVSVF